ncbi:hypothetical protein D3C78_1266580 [compost metagenome]
MSLISCNAQIKESNKPTVNIELRDSFKNADSLILFRFNAKNPCSQSKAVSIIKENKISECFDYVRTIQGGEVKNIINVLYDSDTYGGEEVACFDTDYSLIAVENDVIIGFINISFSCNKLISKPLIIERDKHINESLRKVGFSSSGKKLLLRLLKLA